MALISMAVFDTAENNRTEYTIETLKCLEGTVNRDNHRIFVIDNASCQKTKNELKYYQNEGMITVITLPENVGTARAINKAWKFRKLGEHCVKMDNDVLIYQTNWVELMEEALQRDPKIGIVGLKRKDLEERPDSTNDWYKSLLYFLPHEPGQSWIPFEECQHVMGTCQMYSSALLDKIGYLKQPGIYGFDDSLASLRARIAGFVTGFLPHIQIDHIDRGNNSYIQEKRDMAGKDMNEYYKLRDQYLKGELPIYYEDEG